MEKDNNLKNLVEKYLNKHFKENHFSFGIMEDFKKIRIDLILNEEYQNEYGNNLLGEIYLDMFVNDMLSELESVFSGVDFNIFTCKNYTHPLL